MPFRINYQKGVELKYIGHLDLYRAWERLVRRATLPIAYTQGFNPHPKINMSPALPLGFTSICEIIDIWLEVDYDPKEVEALCKKAAPPGISILSVNCLPENSPALQTQITSVVYRILIDTDCPNVETSVANMLAAQEIPRQRRGKSYDLRQLIEKCEIDTSENQAKQIYLQLASREGATGRPDEFLAEINIPIQLAQVERVRFIGTLA